MARPITSLSANSERKRASEGVGRLRKSFRCLVNEIMSEDGVKPAGSIIAVRLVVERCAGFRSFDLNGLHREIGSLRIAYKYDSAVISCERCFSANHLRR